MKDAIYMSNSPVRLRIKVKREARNETPSRGHVRCIYVCRSFLEFVMSIGLVAGHNLTYSQHKRPKNASDVRQASLV
jgi:hypothetical protein